MTDELWVDDGAVRINAGDGEQCIKYNQIEIQMGHIYISVGGAEK